MKEKLRNDKQVNGAVINGKTRDIKRQKESELDVILEETAERVRVRQRDLLRRSVPQVVQQGLLGRTSGVEGPEGSAACEVHLQRK